MNWRPSSSIAPHEGIGGGAPTPRNDRLASAMIAPESPKVAWTSSAGSASGNRWRPTMRAGDAPRASAASVNSRRRNARICARVSRAYAVQPRTTSATTTLRALGPSMAARVIARSRPGKASSTSMTREIASPTHPPYHPAMQPIATPTTSARPTAAAPTASESRAPPTRRARTSRPRASCPRRCAALGGRRRPGRSVRSGSSGKTRGAATAVRTTSPRAAADRTSPVRRSLRIAQAGIQGCEQDVGAGVDHDVRRPEDERAALDERIVARTDRLDDEASESRPSEDRLGHHGAGEQRAQLEAGDGDYGTEGGAERMDADDPPGRRALGARGACAVLPERVEHARAREANQDARHAETERERGQHQVPGAAPAGRRQPAEMKRERENEERAEPVGRHADAGETRDAHQPVEQRAAAHRRHDAERERDHDRDQERGGRQLERRGQSGGDERRDRLAKRDRLAEIPARDTAEEHQELRAQRPVQSERVAKCCGGGRLRRLAEHPG